jgi:hypothetical protein
VPSAVWMGGTQSQRQKLSTHITPIDSGATEQMSTSDPDAKGEKKLPVIAVPKWKSVLQILNHSFKGGLKSYATAFVLKGGVTFVTS